MESSGYTDDLFAVSEDLRKYSKFVYSIVRLGLMQPRVAQVLSSNYGQIRFQMLRELERKGK